MTTANAKANKLYYWTKFEDEIEVIRQRPEKPSLLLHSCCAPCNAGVLDLLTPYFTITIYYFNPNIYPMTEYDKRLGELQRLLDRYQHDKGIAIALVVPEQPRQAFQAKLAQRLDEAEGGVRCQGCLTDRIAESIRYADQQHFDYVTTVMTISRCKNSRMINESAESLMKLEPKVKYLYSDFKKKDGLLKSRAYCEAYGIYQQQYCGCASSFATYLQRRRQENDADADIDPSRSAQRDEEL